MKLIIKYNGKNFYSIEGIKFMPGTNEINISDKKWEHLNTYKQFKKRLEMGILEIVETHGLDKSASQLTKRHIEDIHDINKLVSLRKTIKDADLLKVIDAQMAKIIPVEKDMREDAKENPNAKKPTKGSGKK